MSGMSGHPLRAALLRLAPAAAVLLVIVVLRGCAPATQDERGSATASSPKTPASRVQVDTAELRAAKVAAGIQPCPTPSGRGSAGSDLPDLTLACLGGGSEVDLSALPGPAVVTVWAQWCGPCRKELGYFERLADTGAVAVLGVDWQDTQPDRALALLRATGAHFPQVADPDNRLGDHYRIPGPPVMLLVDEAGKVTYRAGSVRSYDELAQLVEAHTGAAIVRG